MGRTSRLKTTLAGRPCAGSIGIATDAATAKVSSFSREVAGFTDSRKREGRVREINVGDHRAAGKAGKRIHFRWICLPRLRIPLENVVGRPACPPFRCSVGVHRGMGCIRAGPRRSIRSVHRSSEKRASRPSSSAIWRSPRQRGMRPWPPHFPAVRIHCSKSPGMTRRTSGASKLRPFRWVA